MDEKGEGQRNAERKATVHVPQLKVRYPVLGENNNTIEIIEKIFSICNASLEALPVNIG